MLRMYIERNKLTPMLKGVSDTLACYLLTLIFPGNIRETDREKTQP